MMQGNRTVPKVQSGHNTLSSETSHTYTECLGYRAMLNEIWWPCEKPFTCLAFVVALKQRISRLFTIFPDLTSFFADFSQFHKFPLQILRLFLKNSILGSCLFLFLHSAGSIHEIHIFINVKFMQGSKLRLIRSPRQRTFPPWRLKIVATWRPDSSMI